MWDNKPGLRIDRNRPSGTVESVASRDERHTTRHNNRRTRGRAARDKQLGPYQRKILLYLLREQQRIGRSGTNTERENFQRLGTPWPGTAQRLGIRAAAASTALRGKGRSLIDRHLVSVSKSTGGLVTHVKLTAAGVSVGRLIGPGAIDIRRNAEDWAESIVVERVGPKETWQNQDWKHYAKLVDWFIATQEKQSLAFDYRGKTKPSTPEALILFSLYSRNMPKPDTD